MSGILGLILVLFEVSEQRQNVYSGSEYGGIRLVQGTKSSKKATRKSREERLPAHDGEVGLERCGAWSADLEGGAGEVEFEEPVEQVKCHFK